GLPSSPRHGTVVPMPRPEHDHLLAAYQPELLVTAVAAVQITVTGVHEAVELPSQVTAPIGGAAVPVGVDLAPVDLQGALPGGTREVLGWLENASATPAVARIAVAEEDLSLPGEDEEPGDGNDRVPDDPAQDEVRQVAEVPGDADGSLAT